MIKGVVKVKWIPDNREVDYISIGRTSYYEVDEDDPKILVNRIEQHPEGLYIYYKHFTEIHPWHRIYRVELIEDYLAYRENNVKETL